MKISPHAAIRCGVGAPDPFNARLRGFLERASVRPLGGRLGAPRRPEPRTQALRRERRPAVRPQRAFFFAELGNPRDFVGTWGRFLVKLGLKAGWQRALERDSVGRGILREPLGRPDDQTGSRIPRESSHDAQLQVGRSWSSVTRQDSGDREARRGGLAVGRRGGFRHHLNPGWQGNDPVYWSYSLCRPYEIGSDRQAIPQHCLRRCRSRCFS